MYVRILVFISEMLANTLIVYLIAQLVFGSLPYEIQVMKKNAIRIFLKINLFQYSIFSQIIQI